MKLLTSGTIIRNRLQLVFELNHWKTTSRSIIFLNVVSKGSLAYFKTDL